MQPHQKPTVKGQSNLNHGHDKDDVGLPDGSKIFV